MATSYPAAKSGEATAGSTPEEDSIHGENVPEGELTGAYVAEAQAQEGNMVLNLSERDFEFSGSVYLDPQALKDAARATGTGTHGAAAAAAVEAANGGGGGTGRVIMRNQNATRNLKLQPELENDFKDVLNNEYGADNGRYDVHVTSGGQHPNRKPPGASPRHNWGGAADFDIYDKQEGRYLDMRNGADLAVFYVMAREMAARGWQGQGANSGVKGQRNYYMGPTRMHIGGGTPAAWGGVRKGRRSPPPAPDWLKNANAEGRAKAARGGVRAKGIAGGYSGGNYTNHIVAVDEAAKIQGPRATIASSVGFGGAQKNPAIARAYADTLNSNLGHKPVNWLAKNGPGMAGWESFLQSGSTIANGYMNPAQHLQTWVLGWFKAYPGIGNQIWKGAAGFNTLTNPEDIMRQIVNGGSYTHILNSYLGGFGLSGGGGSGGGGGAFKTDVGVYDPEVPELDDDSRYYIGETQRDAEGALVRAAVVQELGGIAGGLRNGLNMTLENYLKSTKNYHELVSAVSYTGLINPFAVRP